MLKKICISMLTILMLISSVSSVFAATEEEMLRQAPDLYSSERQQMVESARKKLDAKFNTVNQTRASSGYSSEYLNVPYYMQENIDWCGPACMKMVIKYVTGQTVSQSTLAIASNTTSDDGTYVHKMKQVLYNYCGANSYYYYETNELNMKNATVSSLEAGYPVVYQVMTGTLPGYTDDYGHYIVGKGYYTEWNTSGTISETVTCIDPWLELDEDEREYTVTMNALISAVDANWGFYICHVIP